MKNYKICSGPCGKELHRENFSPGQGRCKACRQLARKEREKDLEYKQHSRKLARLAKKNRILNLANNLLAGQMVCVVCEQVVTDTGRKTCDPCNEKNKAHYVPRPKIKKI